MTTTANEGNLLRTAIGGEAGRRREESEHEEWRRSRLAYHRKALAAVAAIALLSALAGTALALTLTSMDVQLIGLWQGSTSAPDIRVTGHDASVQAPNQVDVTADLENTDLSDAHWGNVTVQLLDSGGAILSEETKPTGKMLGDATLGIDYSFTKPGVAADWAETFIIVDQSN